MKIVAIGGGNKDTAVMRGLEMTGTERPNVLIVPSACSTDVSFSRKIGNIISYFTDLGVQPSLLHGYGETPSRDRVQHEVGHASMIYTVGGNSPHMLKSLRAHGSDKEIIKAVKNGAVHAGTSAGALLPFALGHSCISPRPDVEDWGYAYLPMLGVIDATATAHADQHDLTPWGMRTQSRLDAFISTFPPTAKIGYAIDNGAALIFDSDESPEVLSSVSHAGVHITRHNADNTLTTRFTPANERIE